MGFARIRSALEETLRRRTALPGFRDRIDRRWPFGTLAVEDRYLVANAKSQYAAEIAGPIAFEHDFAAVDQWVRNK